MTVVTCFILCSLSLYCCTPQEEITVVVEPPSPGAALIFLHGAGGSGPTMRRLLERLSGGFSQYPTLRLIFPTARPKSFSPFPWIGQIVNVWYNFESLDLATSEDVSQIDESAMVIGRLIEEQVSSGIPLEKICVAGYSSGGLLSLHLGYEYFKDLGCVGAMSAFLPTSSILYKELVEGWNKFKNTLPPLFISGGRLDFLVLPEWKKVTTEAFNAGGVNVTSVTQLTASHFLTKKLVQDLFDFLQRTIL